LYVVPQVGGSYQQLTVPATTMRIAAGGSAAFLAVSSNGIYRHSFDPTKTQQDTPELILPQNVSFSGIAADASYAYYTRVADASVYALPAGGGNAIVLGT